MQGELRVERTYSLGNYQNIKILVAIDSIPFEQLTRKEIRDALTEFLLTNVERVFMQYLDLRSRLSKMPLDQVVEVLNQQYDALNQELAKVFVTSEGG